MSSGGISVIIKWQILKKGNKKKYININKIYCRILTLNLSSCDHYNPKLSSTHTHTHTMSCCRATHTPSAVPWISSEGVCCGALRSGRMICVCVWCMTVRKLAPFWPNRNRCCCEVTSSCVLTITPVTPASASAPSSSSIRTQVAFCRGQRSVIDSACGAVSRVKVCLTLTAAAFPCVPLTLQVLQKNLGCVLKLTLTPNAWATCWITGEPVSHTTPPTRVTGRSKVSTRGCRSCKPDSREHTR